jgi:DnaJ-class molecular chaperone
MSVDPGPQDYYKTLGVSKTATQDEIKNAYRALAKKLHPDLNPGNKQAEARFKQVAEAYETLSDPQKRAAYDRGETQGPFGPGAGPGEGAGPFAGGARFRRRPGAGGPFYSETQGGPGGGRYSSSFSFEDLFGGMGGAGGESPFGDFNAGGEDANYRMDVDFRDAILGGEREITLPNGKRLRVKIPAGIESGAKLRFPGQGNPPVGKGKPGDAYVELNVRPSGQFRRQGRDLVIDLPVSLAEAILGTEIPVPTIDGQGRLRIPPGVTTGSKLRIRGKGVPGRGGEPRGDQIVNLSVAVPKSVDPEFRAAVEKWNREHPFNPREEQFHAA